MSDKTGPFHQDNLDGDPSAHGNVVIGAIITALSWLTVLSLKGASVPDRITGRRVTTALPIAGLVSATGAVLTTVGLFITSSSRTSALYDVTPILDDALTMVAAQMVARTMHPDGLANVADTLGSYKPPEGAREVLRDPSTDSMGVGPIVLTMSTTATAFMEVAANVLAQWPDGQVRPGVVALCLPFAASHTAVTTACWRGFPLFSSSGFGSLITGTQPTVTVACWRILLLAVSGWMVGLVGVVAYTLSFGVTLLLVRHCMKRFGGVNGDVLSAVIEIACAVCAGALAIGF